MNGIRRGLPAAIAGLALGLCSACSAGLTATGSEEPEWPPVARKWFDRAEASFSALDVHDAEASIKNALELEPKRESVRLLAASIALSQMRYDEAVTHLDGQSSTAASGLRARALWYSGRLASAAEELDRLLDDPDTKDPWAEGVAQLARTGEGREPFRMTGALLAVVDMPHLPVPTLIVPLELNGEPVLAMVSTGTPEVVIDSAQQKPTWVSVRFGRRLEVKDVPALSRDLGSLSRRVGAPIKLLLGVNLLRRLNVTFDFYAGQFVVRSFSPPPPPESTAIDVSYIKGGGMVVQSKLGAGASATAAAFLLDTGIVFPLAMTDSGWSKAGLDPKTFTAVPGEANLKQAQVPLISLGGYDIPKVPAVYGLPLENLEQGGGIHLDGVVGSALLAEFRVSLVDQGRTMWLEEMPVAEAAPAQPPAPSEGAAPPKKPQPAEVPVSSSDPAAAPRARADKTTP